MGVEKEIEGRDAERRERYFSCSNIEEEEELDEKTTKEKKRKIPGNLRIQLLRARTMNETNGSMIQARRTLKNNETINPITNIADEVRKEDEEVEKEEEEEKKEKEEECEEVSNEVEQRKDDNEKPKKTIKERRKFKAKRGYKMKGSNKKN